MTGFDFVDVRIRQRRHRQVVTPPISQPVSSVDGDGWQATMVAPADLAMSPVTLSRQGFDAAAMPTTYVETPVTTKRVRLPYPNQATLTADKVALSEFVYATDVIPGAVNNSTLNSPKPVAQWTMTDRAVVGNALNLSLVAFHRNGRLGKPVACVEFTATDGVVTVTEKVSNLTKTVDPLTGIPILEYVATLDISTLAPGAITCNAKVYPWIGSASTSVANSADLSAKWLFSPRVFVKDVARALAPPIIHVSATGSDTTAEPAYSDVDAALKPAATVTGAINRARAILGTTPGALNGLRVKFNAGAWSRPASPTANTTTAEVVFEPVPGVNAADCVFEFGAVSNFFNLSFIKFKGLTLKRMGANWLSNGPVMVKDCIVDPNGNGVTAALYGTDSPIFYINATFPTIAGNFLANMGTQIVALLRGCAFGTATTPNLVDMRCVVGCDIRGTTLYAGTRDQSGTVIAYNRFMQAGSTGNNLLSVTLNNPTIGLAIVQNVFEWCSNGTQITLGLSADGRTNSTEHMILWHNTVAGPGSAGRVNFFYDDTAATFRTHTLMSVIGNNWSQINYKSDIFMTDGARTGSWAANYGVGFRGNFSRWVDASGGNFKQSYPGLSAKIGTTAVAPGQDPLFTDYQASPASGSASSGMGTYTLRAGSPAQGMVVDSPLPFDLLGVERTESAAAGSYA